jgi:uncharacterized protein (TIGR03083 family)
VDTRDALRDLGLCYRAITTTVSTLAESDYHRATRCEGWSVRDLLFHTLLDPHRALVAFASPTDDVPTTDFVEYWRPYRPGTEGAARHAEYVRRAAAAYPQASILAEEWAETSEAALRAAAAGALADINRGTQASRPDPPRVLTQGLVIGVPDLLATLAVEAALHHLDLTLELGDAPPTPPGALAIVRQTLDGVLGVPLPAVWDDRTYALKGTGRLALDASDRSAIGPLQDRFPLLG